jgi:predicted DNA binding CopG/RHH family protein
MSTDLDAQEPFQLNISSIQGKWMCEELGASLTVSGQSVQYTSGECYPIQVTEDGKLEIFGYRGLSKKSDASSVVWKHKETGQYLTWMYEGDNEDIEPEVDASLIIQGSGGRTTRKRKVDYVALDKELDKQESGESGKQPLWASQYADLREKQSVSNVSPEQVNFEFNKMKARFNSWVISTDTERCKSILSKRGYLSYELDFMKSAPVVEAANRVVPYLKSTGVRAMISQSGTSVNIRVPENVWRTLLNKVRTEESSSLDTAKVNEPPKSTTGHSPNDSELLEKVENIKSLVVAFCERDVHTDDEKLKLEESLTLMESLPIDIDILKRTKIGVEINKLSKFFDRAQSTLDKLKAIYLQSKNS